MKLAQFHSLAQSGDVKRLFQMLIDQPAKALRQFSLRVADDRLVGAATPAGAKTRLSRGLRQREEENVLTLRPPRGARRAAIAPGRAHAVIEHPVKVRVARLYSLPKPVFGGRRRFSPDSDD